MESLVIRVAVVIFAVFCVAWAQPAADEVTSLPGVLGALTSRQYSGYLSASGTIKLHYWFVESERSPENDPLILWMHGGPGCSSLDSYLSEIGPYRINPDGKTLSVNAYSWSKVANVIFLEAPAGVGFSYSADQKYATSDDETAMNNYLALLDFFHKFPNMSSKPFFIAGVSYGGVYVPTLSVRVAADASINFQGFAVGNGLLDFPLTLKTAVYYAYYHGIIGEDLWSQLQQHCCQSGNCSFSAPQNIPCVINLLRVYNSVMNEGINPFDVTADCADGLSPGLRYSLGGLFRRFFRRYFEASFSQPLENMVSGLSSSDMLPCTETDAETQYLNRLDVRQALHIPDVVPDWEVCSDTVGNSYQSQYESMRDQFMALLPNHRGLFYSGDTDAVCNFLQGQKFVASLNCKEKGKRRPWLYNHQVAGFVKEYEQVTFMTVKGAGHLVPRSTPGPALQMITRFLNNQPQ